MLALLRAVGPLDSNYNPGSIFDPDEHDFNPADFGPGQPIYPASDQFKPSNFQDFDLIDPDSPYPDPGDGRRGCETCAAGDCRMTTPPNISAPPTTTVLTRTIPTSVPTRMSGNYRPLGAAPT